MKIAILGTASLSRAVAPLTDPEWTIWACSGANMGQLPRIDLWFEMHALQDFFAPENKPAAEPYFTWLKQQTFPVVMMEKNDHIPQAKVYPIREMIERFGRNWFTSTVAYMMAQAICTEGVTEIGLFGVDMAAGEEHYTVQRAGCVRFCEIAVEHGIKITIPHESCLGQPTPMYGYSEATRMGRRLNALRHELRHRLAVINQNADNLVKERAHVQGALENLDYMARTFWDGEDVIGDLNLGEPESQALTATDGAPRFAEFKAVDGLGGLLVPKGTATRKRAPAPTAGPGNGHLAEGA